jgi:hypothetical protein
LNTILSALPISLRHLLNNVSAALLILPEGDVVAAAVALSRRWIVAVAAVVLAAVTVLVVASVA